MRDLEPRAVLRRQSRRSPRAASSSGPSISVSGVRNSWLTLREERGLGAVELGQRFGAPALLLVGSRVGDAGGDLSGDELEEAAVAARRTAETDSGRPPGRRRDRARPSSRSARTAACRADGRQAPRGKCALTRVERDDLDVAAARCTSAHGHSRGSCECRPTVRRAIADAPQRGAAAAVVARGRAARTAGRAGLSRSASTRQRAGIVRASGVGGRRRQLAQQCELPLADDAARVVGVGADDAAGAAVVVRAPGCTRTCSRSPRGSRCAP